jgi:hypothetical protein
MLATVGHIGSGAHGDSHIAMHGRVQSIPAMTSLYEFVVQQEMLRLVQQRHGMRFRRGSMARSLGDIGLSYSHE